MGTGSRILTLIAGLLLRAIAITFDLFVRVAPVIIRLCISTVLLVIVSAFGLTRGIRPAAREISEKWAGDLRGPLIGPLDVLLARLLEVLAILMILLGWVILAIFTVAILRIFILPTL